MKQLCLRSTLLLLAIIEHSIAVNLKLDQLSLFNSKQILLGFEIGLSIEAGQLRHQMRALLLQLCKLGLLLGEQGSIHAQCVGFTRLARLFGGGGFPDQCLLLGLEPFTLLAG